MPLITNYDPLHLAPLQLPQTEGDIREAQIKQQLDLAQLANLRDQPVQERMKIALQQAGLDEQTAYHASQIASATRGQDVDLRGQDVTQRGQDIEANAADVRNKTDIRGQDIQAKSAAGNQLASVLDTYSRAGVGDQPTIAQALANFGNDSLLKAANQTGEKNIQKQAGQQLGVYLSSPEKNRAAFLADLQKHDPEVHAAVMKHLNTIADPTKGAAVINAHPKPLAYRLGHALRLPSIPTEPPHLPSGKVFDDFLNGLYQK